MTRFKKPVTAAAVLIAVLALLVHVSLFLLKPEYPDAGGLGAKGFCALEQDSVDVLFLGSSQVFCGIDTVKLTETYGVSAYSLAASAQYIPMTEYYLKEALKTQHPKTVLIDICQLFYTPDAVTDGILSWSFDIMPNTAEKEEALKQYIPDDAERFSYMHLPFLRWRSRVWAGSFWQELSVKLMSSTDAAKTRGFVSLDPLEPQTFAYLAEDAGPVQKISQDAIEALNRMSSLCKENGIRLILFKIPSPAWTRSDHNVVTAFAQENGYEFIDLSEHISGIGLDGSADCYGPGHLSRTGAEKVVDYMYTNMNELFR